MIINQEAGRVVFNNIVSATRELGSDENITVAAPAEKAVACNAKGVFQSKDLQSINDSAKTVGAKLAEELSA